ncbi:hypothetical protein A3D77_06315 [Candidatus Gottesmanbacteria bacterium RIFCSPHIGHO2_02_FULL_39_11]|uniref:Antitoxin n=1 Tax=Candidatus Gottesmanbacteria bacterium RIFCSPHIGHO2_02_FULL_39_11 TaxID=1798382 RepID=A0A1F5ZNL5_9BACT|nr:MAG: hypothetical protein A3D77_06315 [Candidatus Gottesmanbacteria bacterium RIFCSPHIGHO2_02_FULL_39_11]
MNPFIDITTITASKARAQLFELLENTSKGKGAYEIQLRGKGSAILMDKEEFEGWLETIDIMSDPKEYNELKRAMKSKKRYSYEQVKKMLKWKDEA